MARPYTSTGGPISVNLSTTVLKMAPGAEPVMVIADVRNSSSEVDLFKIEVEGLNAGWYTVSLKSLSLYPGDTNQITIQLHPQLATDTLAGTYPFAVRVTSEADPNMFGQATATLVVSDYLVVQAALTPRRVTGRQGRYKLSLANGSNKELQFELVGHEAADELSYKFKNPRPLLDSGMDTTIPVQVKPKKLHLIGLPQRYDFEVRAIPAGGDASEAQVAPGEFIHRTYFKTKWVPIVLLSVLLIVGLLFCGIISLRCDTPLIGDIFCPKPEVLTFVPSAPVVNEGDTVTLKYSVKGFLEKATVTINDTPVALTPLGVPTPSSAATASSPTPGRSEGVGEHKVKPNSPSTNYILCVSDSNHPGSAPDCNHSVAISVIPPTPIVPDTPVPTDIPVSTTTSDRGGSATATSGGPSTNTSTRGATVTNTPVKPSPTITRLTPTRTVTNTPTGPVACKPEPNRNGTASANSIQAGNVITFTANNYKPGTEATWWIMSPPDYSSLLTRTLTVGQSGTIVLPLAGENRLDPVFGQLPGRWKIAFKGTANNTTPGTNNTQTSEINFCLTAPPPVNTPSPGCPSGRNKAGTFDPFEIRAGDLYSSSAWGFAPDENVLFTLSSPSNATKQPSTTRANENGVVFDPPTSLPDRERGLWKGTYRGVSSGHESIIYFCVK